MSKKLDYFTIIIVALCIVAIIFLLVKMMDLLSEDKAEAPTQDPIETVADEDFNDENDDETIDYDLSEGETPAEEENLENEETETLDDAASLDSTEDFEDEIIEEPEERPTEAATEPAEIDNRFNSTGGKYLVISGTFKIKENGDNFAKKLHKLNYPNAQCVIFDKGTYAVVVADRFDNLNAAKKLEARLEEDGYDTYIKIANN